MKQFHMPISDTRLDPVRLREARQRKGWTQKELAVASGFSEDYISQLERASTTRNKGTKLTTMVKLARALDVPLEELLAPDSALLLQTKSPLYQIQQEMKITDITETLQDPKTLKLEFTRPSHIPQPLQQSLTEEQVSSSPNHLFPRIDPHLLREYRLRKNWTQKELAAASGFKEDYISQLERSLNTRNKGTKIETAARLAYALEIPVEYLLTSQDQSNGVLSELWQFYQTQPEIFWQQVPTTYFAQEPTKRLAELLDRISYFIEAKGLWRAAEKKAIEVRTVCPVGSEDWAEITLRHCAYMRQQAGDVVGAQAYLQEVEQHYIKALIHPHPHILALYHTRHGWLADEQYGYFQQASTAFTLALSEAIEAGDQETERTARHFRFRTLIELAMRESDIWLGLRPLRSLRTPSIQAFSQSFVEDWRIAQQFDPDNPQHYYYRFMMHALINPHEAQKEIPLLTDISQQKNSERFLKLLLARWQFSNQEWDTATHFAQEAFQGFCQAAFPYGIALSSALWAKALFSQRLRTKADCKLCLDLWIVALLLHPYQSHPLFALARIGMSETEMYVKKTYPQFIIAYQQDIRARITEREGIFKCLKYQTNG